MLVFLYSVFPLKTANLCQIQQEQLLSNPLRITLNQALTCGQLIVSRGFKYERHFSTTEDGYIHQLYRITNSYAQTIPERNLRPILVLQLGFHL
uniref:Partial AB-hydrolase lipase domain-containing protein n=1 Tax=Tetranychus urticae TaxID=32264 RepID=T1KPH8_TETUR